MSWENMSLEDMYKVYENKKKWHGTDNKALRDVYHMNNNNTRSMYGMNEEDDISMGELKTYIDAAEKQLVRDNYKNALLTNITNHANNGNPQVEKSADAIRNFSYNPDNDAAYKSYVDMYNRQGQSAAKSAMNNLASTNMGRGSSYSAAATAQVQQAYAKKASEMIPTLAEQAYNKLLQQYNIDRDMANDSYNRQLQAYNLIMDSETADYDNAYRKAQTKGTDIANEYLPQEYVDRHNMNISELESQKLKNEGVKIDNANSQRVYDDDHLKNIADVTHTNASTESIREDTKNKILAGRKAAVELEYLPEQIKQDLQMGNLKYVEQYLLNVGLGYENRINAVSAIIAETYGMDKENAELIAINLDNAYAQKKVDSM